MSPRSYRLGKRVESVEQTRARIVAATREILARDGYPRLPIDEVANRADVARATVYYQFGSKHGLIEAVVDDIRQRSGQPRVDDVADSADPVVALGRSFEAGCRFWAAEHVLVRKLTGLALVDPEVRRLLARVDKGRLPLLTRLVERLADTGHLAAGCTQRRAVDVLWMLSSFEAFDQLFTGRRLPVREVANALTDTA